MEQGAASMFFAVTVSQPGEIIRSVSLYLVSVADDEPDQVYPIVKKIGLRGESSIAIGESLTRGVVGIMADGLVTYEARSPSLRPEQVKNNLWHATTAPITGLFLDESEARTCFAADNLRPADPRWRQQTQEVLEQIGDDHPMFVPSQGRWGISYE